MTCDKEGLRSRQVHLDFHTSELIPGVGSKFIERQFQEALQAGHVNSITVFAKCHHSWSYYPTQVGRPHPTLETDLLGRQIAACHEIGVRAPIYYTVGWSANDAEAHPEWLQRRQDGTCATTNYDLSASAETVKPTCSWKNLCINGEYRAHILAQTEEICKKYTVDGFFYDICFVGAQPCWCDVCKAKMEAEGIDHADYAKALAYTKSVWLSFQKECAQLIHSSWPSASIYFNGLAHPEHSQMHGWETHFELEDLPTTWGGYDKMPPRARYFARTDRQYLGMTGKFHTMWGEFGGFKNPDALKYECAAMLAYGARCSVGDQLHPNGLMDMDTYRLIGEAYSYVEQVENWCLDTEPLANIGIFLSGDAATDEGLASMLLECRLDFRVVADGDDTEGIEVIILPDRLEVGRERADYLQKFISSGGAVVASGTSGIDALTGSFALDFGVDYVGPARYRDDYLVVGSELAEGMVTSPLLVYEGATRTALKDGQVLASIKEPYFDRTYGTYCSHQNTPYREEVASHPAAVRKGSLVYLAHPIFRLYHAHGAYYHRQYFLNALKLVYGGPLLDVAMPSCGRATLGLQKAENRYIVQVLYASPLKRGRTLVIEDLPALTDIDIKARLEHAVIRVYMAPSGQEIPFEQEGNLVKFTIPEVKCHQIVVLDMGEWLLSAAHCAANCEEEEH